MAIRKFSKQSYSNRTPVVFSLFHLNIRSLRNKLPLLQPLLASLNYPDLVCISEHWLSHSIVESIVIDGYDLINAFGRVVCRGGGVLIFTRRGAVARALTVEPVLNIEKDFEYTAIHYKINSNKLIIVCIYRSPCGSFAVFIEKLLHLLESLMVYSCSLVLCGDFNMDFSVPSQQVDDTLNLLISFNLRPLVNEATRITPDSATLLDNIFTDLNSDSIRATVGDSGLSDHCYQLMSAVIKSLVKNDVTKYTDSRTFSDANVSQFQELLAKEDWNDVIANNDPCISFERFHNTFSYYFNTCFPLKRKRVKVNYRLPWYSSELLII